MYTYKRLRTSKSAVIIILIALALAAWGILGLTGAPLARKGGTTFVVELHLKDSAKYPVIFYDGESRWPNLDVTFRSLSHGGSDHHVQVGPRIVDLFQLSLKITKGYIVSVGVFFLDDEGTLYEGWTDVSEPKPALPENVGDSFLVPINKPIDVFRSKGKDHETKLGTVCVDYAEYERTE